MYEKKSTEFRIELLINYNCRKSIDVFGQFSWAQGFYYHKLMQQ